MTSASRRPTSLARAILVVVVVTALGPGCVSSAPPPPAPPSRILAYQDSAGGWREDTAAVVFPVLRHRVSPGIPSPAERVSGEVSLKVQVTKRGDVGEVVVIKSLSHAMDLEAITAVHQWSYSPATLNGEAVAVWMTITVSYQFAGSRSAG